MRTALPVGLSLLLIAEAAIACLDVLFVLDPSSQHSRARSTKVANELAKRNGLRFSAAVRRHEGRYVFMMAKTSADLIATLDTVEGDYERYLGMVTSEIMRRRNVRPLVILLFSETAVNATLSTKWKELSRNRKIHVFRVGTTKATNELSVDGGESFEDLLACSPISKEVVDVRRQPAVTEPSITTTFRPRIIPFSKTTRPPTTTRRVTVPGPKIRPIYRRKDVEAELKADFTRDVFPAPQPSVSQPAVPQPAVPQPAVTQPPVQHPSAQVSSTSHRPLPPVRATTPRSIPTTPSTTTRPTTTTVIDRTPAGCVADIVFLMDFSDGTGDKSKPYLDIAAATVGRLPISPHAVRVSLIRFSGPGRTETLFHLDKHNNKDDLIEEMFRMEPTGGTTKTGEALHYAIKEFADKKHGARKNARKFIVLFTDGYAQDDPVEAADFAREQGITVLAVAVEDRFKPNEQELVEVTKNREMILISPNGHQLREKILGNLCSL